eukprot:UN02025
MMLPKDETKVESKSVDATDGKSKLDLNGVWEYSTIENLDASLVDMEVNWAKRTLAASVAAVVTCTYTVVQNGDNITQTIKTPLGGTTRSYSVSTGHVFKYKTYKKSDMESKYEWNDDKSVLHGESKNITRGMGYNYTLHVEKDDKNTKLFLVTYSKNDTPMTIVFIKKE